MMEVERFIADSQIDERAQEIFRSLDEEVQLHVISMGDLQTAQNPSSALLGRIKQAQQQSRRLGQFESYLYEPHTESTIKLEDQHAMELESFIDESHIDEMAENALRGISEDMQAAVIAMGPLSNAKNPSSALLGRIKQAQHGRHSGPSHPVSEFQTWAEPPTDTDADLDQFIADSNLDERAEEALRGLDPLGQVAIMSMGPLVNAKNPSSALLGRIRQVQQQARQPEQFGRDTEYRVRAEPFHKSNDTIRVPSQAILQRFIVESCLDERAEEAFRGLDRESQDEIIAMGPLVNAQNPSSALLGRIRQVQQQGRQSGQMGMVYESHAKTERFMCRPDDAIHRGRLRFVEQFIADSHLDERAEEAFRSLDLGTQMDVINMGPLAGAQNPSSALLGRIRQAQQVVKPPWQYSPAPQFNAPASHPIKRKHVDIVSNQIEQFIIDSRLDERAEEAFRNLDRAMQLEVVDMGPLDNAKNPSSALLGRIRNLQNQPISKTWASSSGPRPSTATKVARGAQHSPLEQFIWENRLDSKASDALHSASEAIQDHVIGLGSLANCTNPSSACLGRIKAAASKGAFAVARRGGMQQAAPSARISQRLSSHRYNAY